MDVYTTGTKEAAAMGGGLLAKYAWWNRTNSKFATLEEMMEGKVVGLQCVAMPRSEISRAYEQLVGAYITCEEYVVKQAVSST
jgi:xylulokinase